MFETIVAGLFLLIGTGVTVAASVNFVYGLLSRRWPTTRGTVLTSLLENVDDGEGGIDYRFHVVYRYVVEGRNLTAKRWRYGNPRTSEFSMAAHDAARRYREGATVNVYYDPDDPTEAVLEPGVGWHVLAQFALGGLFLLAGVMMLRGDAG